jgi:TPR repeat protein
MNWVGRYYDEGWEVARDTAVALTWYRKSALGGDFRGQASYASMLALQGEIAAAVAWLQRARTTATPVFARQLAADLARSPHAPLREVAAEMEDGFRLDGII